MEVKTNEGLASEAVISKLTDASLYTVGESHDPGFTTLAGLRCFYLHDSPSENLVVAVETPTFNGAF